MALTDWISSFGRAQARDLSLYLERSYEAALLIQSIELVCPDQREHEVDGHWQTCNRNKGHCPGKGSFKFTNIGGEASGDELDQIPGQGHLLLLGFLMQDCHTGFQIRNLKIC
jgi:hypothetical protein